MPLATRNSCNARRDRGPQIPSAAPKRNPRSINRCWTRLTFATSRRSSNGGVVSGSTVSGTTIDGGAISVRGADACSSGGVLCRMTIGMRGLWVVARSMADCCGDAVVSVDVESAGSDLGFEMGTSSRVLVVGSGSQDSAPAKTRITSPTAPLILQTLAALLASGPSALVLDGSTNG
jgi:hypothetical protein